MSETRERTGLLIETVKNYPVLYDPNHEEYRNSKFKNNTWNAIALIVGDNNGDATKARWRNLRDCYSKHLRCKTSTGPVSKHNARYKSWPWVQQMSYLEPFIGMESPNPTQNGLDNEKNITEGQSRLNESDHHSQNLKSLKRTREENDWQVDKVISFLNSKSSTDFDDIDLIFLGYSRTIKKFSPHKQVLAKYKIAQLMKEIELNNIREKSQSADEFVNTEDGCISPIYVEHVEVKMEAMEDNSD